MSEQLFWLCEHGEVKAHSWLVHPEVGFAADLPELHCTGGRPVEGGEKVWWCDSEGNTRNRGTQCVLFTGDAIGEGRHVKCGWRFLIPLSNSETTK